MFQSLTHLQRSGVTPWSVEFARWHKVRGGHDRWSPACRCVMRPSGIFLLASWRLGFTLFLWITTIFLLLLVVKCLKSLALALKNQG